MCFATDCGDFSFSSQQSWLSDAPKSRLVTKLSETIGQVQHFAHAWPKDFSSLFNFAFNFLDLFKITWEFSKQFSLIAIEAQESWRHRIWSVPQKNLKISLAHRSIQSDEENRENLIENVLLVFSSDWMLLCAREKKMQAWDFWDFLWTLQIRWRQLVWASIAVRKNCLENSRVILKWSRKWTPN